MKSKTILGADGATKMRQITVGIHGKGGEAGIKAIQQLAGMVDSLKQCQTPQEVYDRYLQITGYCKCCVDCNFIDQKGADELMCLAAYLAGNEQARAEAQQKAGRAGKRYSCGAYVVEKLRFCYCWREIRHNRGNGQRNTYSKYAGNCGYRCKPD